MSMHTLFILILLTNLRIYFCRALNTRSLRVQLFLFCFFLLFVREMQVSALFNYNYKFCSITLLYATVNSCYNSESILSNKSRHTFKTEEITIESKKRKKLL